MDDKCYLEIIKHYRWHTDALCNVARKRRGMFLRIVKWAARKRYPDVSCYLGDNILLSDLFAVDEWDDRISLVDAYMQEINDPSTSKT